MENDEFELIDRETSNDETSASEETASSPDNSENKTRKHTNRSPIRDYLIPTSDGGKKYMICEQLFGNLTAIMTINRHFQNFHPLEYTIISKLKQKRLNPYSPNDKLKVDALNDKLLEWIIVDQQAFLLSESKLHRILLDFIPFDEAHTAANQADMIIKLLKEMGIGQKLLGITTDNASNMISMRRILKEKLHVEFNNESVQHFRCGAHVLNLGVEEGIKLISKEIKKAREFSIKLRNSLSLIRELKKILR
ncbi:17507_t:CDS:2 [Racocetra fulgida]|uniref:17507_t:CDS:1 n=1 Tax=Racocetra fulgida TaxID=60492 RepID=A0A9N9NTZ3_9GLOM|nr:17507_t:CDS:2 [Racocetra fulgida]